MAVKKINDQPSPILPPLWDKPDATALQALAQGKATPEQQQRALNWIIYGAANTYDLDYRTDSRDHAFVSGRRFVGLQIIKLIKLNLMAISGKVNDNVYKKDLE